MRRERDKEDEIEKEIKKSKEKRYKNIYFYGRFERKKKSNV